MIVEKFQTFGVIITGKYISEPINESVYFYSCTQAKLPFGVITPRQKKVTHFPLPIIYIPSTERREDYGAEKNDQN